MYKIPDKKRRRGYARTQRNATQRNATRRNSLAVSYYPIKKTLCMSVPIFGMLMHSVFLFVIEKESL